MRSSCAFSWAPSSRFADGNNPPASLVKRKIEILCPTIEESRMSNLPEVTDQSWEAEIVKGGPALVKFWAEW